jgi:hypothetical protein
VALPQLLRESFPPAAAGLWVNIADRASRFVSRQELAQITGGLVQPTYVQQISRELTPIHEDFDIEQPRTIPAMLVQRLRESLRNELDVSRGFIFQLNPGTRNRRLVVGIRMVRLLDEQPLDALLKRVRNAVNAGRSGKREVGVIVLDFAKYQQAVKKCAPMFER